MYRFDGFNKGQVMSQEKKRDSSKEKSRWREMINNFKCLGLLLNTGNNRWVLETGFIEEFQTFQFS